MTKLPAKSAREKTAIVLGRVVGPREDIVAYEPFDYAPWGRRIAALAFDALIAVPLAVLGYGIWEDGLGMPDLGGRQMQHAFDIVHLGAMTAVLLGPGMFDLIYTMATRIPMTPGMHVARLGIVDTEELGTHPTRVQLIVRWLVKWVGVISFFPFSWALVFLPALLVPTRRGLHEMASHTITYRRPIWNTGEG